MHAMPVCVLYKIFRALSFKLFYNVRHREFTPLHFSIECTTWVSTKMHHPGAPLRKDFLADCGECGQQTIFKNQKVKIGKDVEKRDLLYTVGRNMNW